MHLLSCLKPVTYRASLRVESAKSQGNFSLFRLGRGPLGGVCQWAGCVGDSLSGALLSVGSGVGVIRREAVGNGGASCVYGVGVTGTAVSSWPRRRQSRTAESAVRSMKAAKRMSTRSGVARRVLGELKNMKSGE